MRRFFRIVILLLDAGLLILFLVGYLARYGHPSYAWWAELIAIALPFLSVLLIGATILVALARRWKLLAVHLVLIVLAALRFVSFESGVEPAQGDLTLMTFNTSRGGGARAEDLGRAITALVRAEAPDLAAFQESYIQYHPTTPTVRPEPVLATLVDSLGYRTIGPDGGQHATYTPQPVLGRVELIEQTQAVRLLELNGTNRTTSRVVRTHFRWQGREAVHYNLHLHSFGSDKPWQDETYDPFSPGFWMSYLRQYRTAYFLRAKEIDQVRAMLEAEHLPLIVSGDFNSTPHNSAFYSLADGFQDAYGIAGRGWGATYHVDWPVARIDHVLVGPEWKVVSAHVAASTVSDHLPLVVRLRWRE